LRIVSLCPSITETLIDFGLAESLAGITRYCIHPRSITRKLNKVGGTKNPDIAAILMLQPDLVFMNEEENTKEAHTVLSDRLHVEVSFPRTVTEVPAMLRRIGQLTDRIEMGERRARELENTLAELESKKSEAFRFAYLIWRDPWMTVGTDTYVSDLISRAGGINVYADSSERYPTTSMEDLHERRADLVLLPDEPYRFKDRDRGELTRILPNTRIELVSGDDCSWHGVRSIRGVALVGKLSTR
jgi:ABC-type Fe3+-hydroxamate transport system substrate-binding protein